MTFDVTVSRLMSSGREALDSPPRDRAILGPDTAGCLAQWQRQRDAVPTRMPIRGDHASASGTRPWSSIVNGPSVRSAGCVRA